MVNEPMEFKTTRDPTGDIEVIQSKENEVFYGYLNFLKKKRQERAPFDTVLRDSSATKDDTLRPGGPSETHG